MWNLFLALAAMTILVAGAAVLIAGRKYGWASRPRKEAGSRVIGAAALSAFAVVLGMGAITLGPLRSFTEANPASVPHYFIALVAGWAVGFIPLVAFGLWVKRRRPHEWQTMWAHPENFSKGLYSLPKGWWSAGI